MTLRSSSPRVRYTGEDTRPTSPLELRGWYTYGVAAEVFVICGVGSFLPVLLEQLARERGVVKGDPKTPCVEVPRDAGTRSLALRGTEESDPTTCVVNFFGVEVSTASFALYTFSAAILVQVLVLVSISALADYGNNRKRLLMTLGLTGSTCCCLMLLVSPQVYLLAPLLGITSVTCLGSSFVLLNAYLPLYAAHHPSVSKDGVDLDPNADPPIHLTSMSDAENELRERGLSMESHHSQREFESTLFSQTNAAELLVSTQISARGYAYGYSAALFVQVLSIGFLIVFANMSPSTSSGTLPMRMVLFAVGLWWLLFTLLSGKWLRSRPGPPLPVTLSKKGWLSYLSYVAFSWKSIYKTIKVAIRLRQMLKFLIAWLFLSDALATVADTAILFGKTELQMSTAGVATIALLATGSAVASAFLWPRIQAHYAWQPKTVILLSIGLFEIIPLNGLLGFLPWIHMLGIGGIQSAPEIYAMAMIHGTALGGFSAYCRAFFGNLVPPGSEAAFFALYAFTDNGSSIFGPAVVGRIADVTGSLRGGFWFIAVLIAIPAPLVWLVDADRGREEAVGMAKLLGGGAKVERTDAASEEGEGLLTETTGR